MRLGVNIDHIATLRSQRGTPYPDPVDAVPIVELAGADGITCHIRIDRRHITERDVRLIREITKTSLNVELCSDPDIVRFVCGVKPRYACLVPEREGEQTTEGGLDIVTHGEEIKRTIGVLKDAGIVVSLFVEPDESTIGLARELGADSVELNTRAYSETSNKEGEIERLKKASIAAHGMGLEVHAGHGLEYHNVKGILSVPHIVELNIGHSIISRAVFTGLEEAVKTMLRLMKGG
ncbi:pyridoxine 5'-phosphate synthase [candidate division WOR-3 bacterium JGI_Cruoil_03_44_89]|uniref:Pyridoxine 5'-phosphate synthase n=1 Tax=candidate division WOR-3 bacterium JGI_Cruoil_03_44_89 TaxID=1973748 RepID=A0A235BWJ3_UNCW3|nr:MAG: pyridoxine 5'-phosphate synthase [candidate division WOR-3 bacterium JGI_Cruoil_03_44_89]